MEFGLSMGTSRQTLLGFQAQNCGSSTSYPGEKSDMPRSTVQRLRPVEVRYTLQTNPNLSCWVICLQNAESPMTRLIVAPPCCLPAASCMCSLICHVYIQSFMSDGVMMVLCRLHGCESSCRRQGICATSQPASRSRNGP